MADILTPEQVEAIRGRHRPSVNVLPNSDPFRVECQTAWPCDAALLLADHDALTAEVGRLTRALAGHLFDGESLSARGAIRSELIKQGLAAIEGLDALTARAEAAERKVAEVRAVCAQIDAMPIPADPGLSQTEITRKIITTIVRVIRRATLDGEAS